VNKADGRGLEAARRAQAEFEQVLHYLRPATEGWQSVARTCSASSGEGVTEAWEMIQEFKASTGSSGAFDRRRRDQEREWMLHLVQEGLLNRFRQQPGLAELSTELETQVMDGSLPATTAARRLLDAFESNN